MTPELRAAANHLRAFLDDIDECFRATGTDPTAHRDKPVILAPGYDLTIGDLHVLLAATDPAEQNARADFMPDSTEDTHALMAEPLTLTDTDAIRRTRDYLGVHTRVHGPHVPIATIDESNEPGGHLWRLTAADLGRTLTAANPHTTYEGMQALRRGPLTTTQGVQE